MKRVRRVIAVLIALAVVISGIPISALPVRAEVNSETTRTGNLNYFSNQGELNEDAFVQLPMGAVEAKTWLKQQMYLMKNGLTGAIHDQYALYGPDNGWRGGTGDGWEKGAYYLRGLVALAWVLDDPELKENAMEWIDFILDSQRDNGFMGPVNDGDGSSNGWDWWPRMVILQVIRDYYEATELAGEPDPRVMPFFENYFKYQSIRLPEKPLQSWAASRGGDNIEVLLWYYNRTYDESDPSATDWIIDLAMILVAQTKSQDTGKDWVTVFNETTVREHVVNTTQAMKTPAVISQLPGNESAAASLKQGIFNMNIDHGRVDNLANADEGARENYPYRGAELCSVVESLLSNEMSIRIMGESWIGDMIEEAAYNNLPAGFASDYTGHNYYQAQNQVLATHGNHEFDCDHGDDSAYGAMTGFECCFPNMHMGWPKFVQSMWMGTRDNGLAVIAYGPNKVTAKVADGKTAVFDQVTDYPFEDTVALNYQGETAEFPLKLRLPGWCEAPVVKINGEVVDISMQEKGFAVIDRTWQEGDQAVVTFPMELSLSNWYNDAKAVKYGPLIFALKVEEDWRIGTDDAAREIQYQPVGEFDRREIYPASDWNYALVVDEANPEASLVMEKSDEIALQPFTLDNAPLKLKATGQLVPEWKLKGNVVPEPPYSPIAEAEELQEEIELVPYACTRLRITQMPYVGTPSDDGVTARTAADADIYEENGVKVTEFDNLVVPSAEDYTLAVTFSGSGNVTMNINQMYEEEITVSDGETRTFAELCSIVPGSNRYFYFGYGKYNNIRFFGDAVEITELKIIPEDRFTEPELISAVLSKDGKSATLTTNIDRSAGFYTVHYGTESGSYTKTAENFFDRKAVITGLEPGQDYYFQVSMLAGGENKVTEEVAAQAGVMKELAFKDDFSDPAASKKNWSVLDPSGALSFADGKMSVGVSDNVKAMVGDEGWSDYTVVAKMQGTGEANRDFGIIVRATDIRDGSDGYNGYYIGLNAKANGLNIGYANGGWNFIAAPAGVTYTEGKEYELKVIIVGERLAVYVDDVKLYDELVSDMRSDGKAVPLFKEGCVGVRSWNQAFDVNEFEVREIGTDEYEDLGIENNLFEDDFAVGTESEAKWTVSDPDGAVTFTDGKLEVGNSTNLKIMAGTGEEDWEDYAVEAKLAGPEDPERDFGVMFRCSDVTGDDADSYKGYYVGIDALDNGLNIGYADNDWYPIEKVSAFTYQPGKVYDLKILVCGNQFKVYVDGELEYQRTDSKFSTGAVGLRSWNQPFEATYFKVRKLSAEEEAQFDGGEQPEDPEPEVPQFTDDFEDPDVSAANWRLCGDQSKMKFDGSGLIFGTSNNIKAVAGNEQWTDYVAEATVTLEGNSSENAGLMYRVTDVAENGSDGYQGYYYGIGVNSDGSGYYIMGYADGDWHQMIRENIETFDATAAHRLKVVVYQDCTALYLDGELMTQFLSARYSKGMIGLRSYLRPFTADDVEVRPVEEADLEVFAGMSRYIDESFGAYKTIQLKFPKFSNTKTYKIVYGEEPGNYTNEIYNLIDGRGNTRSDKQGLTVPENDKDYYLRIIALDGKDETIISDEVVVHTGESWDVSGELDKLSAVLAEAGEVSVAGCSEESIERLDWAITYAEAVMADQNSNLMNIRLAKNSLQVGMNELEAGQDTTVLSDLKLSGPKQKVYFIGDSLNLDGLVVRAVYGDGTEKTLAENEYQISGFDSSAPGELTIIVTYKENRVTRTAEFKVTVKQEEDKSVLITLVDKAADLKQGTYTDASWKAFVDARNKASAVLKDREASKAEIDQTLEALIYALAGLQEGHKESSKVDKSGLQTVYNVYKGIKNQNYTDTSWKQFRDALSRAAAVLNNSKATAAQVTKALDDLARASLGLEVKKAAPALVKGKVYTVKDLKYKVIAVTKGKEAVRVTGAKKKTVSRVTIPAKVKINGVSCKVTEVGSKAFKNYKKLSRITIGSSVRTIGKQAFYGCKRLKNITVKSSVLKKVGSSALKKIHSKAVIKVPKKKRAAYKKLFRNKGQKKTVVIK